MLVVESIVPQVCDRGYWKYHACAAGPDHVHVILSSQHDPQTIRRLLKRWIGQELSKQYALPEGATWWAECGSVRWIDEPKYYKNAMEYVTRQSAKTGPRTARLNLEA
jgi:REP element-mobilizing transposase RayT